MKVYVLLLWFYEGDSNLVNSFIGVYSSEIHAMMNCTDNLEFMELNENGEPKEYGTYGSNNKYEIREIEL